MDAHHPLSDDQQSSMPSSYGPPFYPEDPNAFMPYGQLGPYHVSPRTNMSVSDMQPHNMAYHGLALVSPHQYQTPVYPPHVPLAPSATPPPPSPEIYDGIPASDHSSSGANSPPSSRSSSLVHRHHRYNPTPSPTGSLRRRGRSHDTDEEENMGLAYPENLAHSRKEATRRQRIEAEQRRRDELRDGYAKLKDVLPVSNQKSSKVSLLDRATNHIINLERANKEMQARINALEAEMARLRSINEKISLGNATEAPSPAVFDRPSPAPEGAPPTHSLTAVKGQDAPSENSSPASGEGF
ncbi:hypothetical protein AX16_000337 [Volvariella volvacea WC 439]|nr:hypothetical protein AX16_000337 [Volvariella volvacea WC 439]